MNIVSIDEMGFYGNEIRPKSLTIDLAECDITEVRIESGKHFVASTPEHIIECLSWLLTNVDTDTLVTKDGVEVDS